MQSTGNGNGRLAQIKVGTSTNDTSLLQLQYSYDSFGNIASATEKFNNGTATPYTFSYDDQNRVLEAYGVASGNDYAYDNSGRLTSYEGSAQTVNATFPVHAIKKSGYTYNSNGNLATRNGRTLVWDAQNHLQAVKNGSTTEESYLYDPDGNRVKKTVGSIATFYPFPHYEMTGSTVTKYYFFNGQRIAMNKGGVERYLLTDHLNSTVIELDAGGALTADQKYRAYGNQRDTGAVMTDHRFTGQKVDNTGLMYYGARYYDLSIGAFISPDTIVPDATNVFDYNRYMYVRGRALNASDPSGHRLYFAAGAGHDPSNTGYIPMMVSTFAQSGIVNPVDIPAHGNKWSDVLFTVGDNSKYAAGSTTPYVSIPTREDINPLYGVYTMPVDWRVTQALDEISADLQATPLGAGEQLNLLGYSTGSVVMAQAALQMANDGHIIDNLILLGTPILADSDLFQLLQSNSNIKNILRIDIPGDDVATVNQSGLNAATAMWNFGTKGDFHPHFRYAFGDNAMQYTAELALQLQEEGVK